MSQNTCSRLSVPQWQGVGLQQIAEGGGVIPTVAVDRMSKSWFWPAVL
jgi:hypothetical protein